MAEHHVIAERPADTFFMRFLRWLVQHLKANARDANQRSAIAAILLFQSLSSFAAPGPAPVQATQQRTHSTNERSVPKLRVSSNGRFLQSEDGRPFFWLGDTAWLLFERLDREDALRYLENRQRKGFNLVQVMVIRSRDGRQQSSIFVVRSPHWRGH